MTSVLDAIVKLPRYVRILATNGIDSNNAVVEDSRSSHYKRNKDRLKKAHHNYYIKHKEKLKDYYRKYYQNNRDLVLAKKKIYNDNNKEQIKEYRKKYWLAKERTIKIKTA